MNHWGEHADTIALHVAEFAMSMIMIIICVTTLCAGILSFEIYYYCQWYTVWRKEDAQRRQSNSCYDHAMV